jgi:RPA family protein
MHKDAIGGPMALALEPAWRIFANEFNKSTLQLKEEDGSGRTYVISPTGAKINRLFIVGVLTEVEDVRTNDDLWRARVADPTGSFTVYAGKYQFEGASFLANADVPQFVAVLGRARLYTRADTSYASIWSNEISSTTEAVRNNWVITTAERTLERLEALKIAQGAGLEGDALRSVLLTNNVNAVLADGIIRAWSSYNGSDVIAEMPPIVASAIDTVAESHGFKPASEENHVARNTATEGSTVQANENVDRQTGEAANEQKASATTDVLAKNKERVLLTMSELDSGPGIPYDRLIELLETQGLQEDDVEDAVQELMDEGKCYEPKLGILKLI